MLCGIRPRRGSLAARYLFASAVTVTSMRAPFLSLTSSPCSLVKVFSIRRSRCRWSALSTAICAFSGWLGRGDGMIFSTVPGMVVLGCSGIRAVSRFSSLIVADLAMRGFAISLLTLARVAWTGSFLAFLCRMHLSSLRDGCHAVTFRTAAKYAADSCRGITLGCCAMHY
jgi:hypothetical protein